MVNSIWYKQLTITLQILCHANTMPKERSAIIAYTLPTPQLLCQCKYYATYYYHCKIILLLILLYCWLRTANSLYHIGLTLSFGSLDALLAWAANPASLRTHCKHYAKKAGLFYFRYIWHKIWYICYKIVCYYGRVVCYYGRDYATFAYSLA